MTNVGPKANYTALADFFASYPDTLAIRRFRRLQIKNLLYYQAELAHLEQELQEIEDRDARLREPRYRANFMWAPCTTEEELTGAGLEPPSTDPGEPEAFEYRQKVLHIRRTLYKYNEAVEQFRRLGSIPNPGRSTMTVIHGWLGRITDDHACGEGFLRGNIEDVWTVKLSQPSYDTRPADPPDFYHFEDQNGLAFRIGGLLAWIHFLGSLITRSSSNKVHHIDTSASGTLDQTISTVAASILPVLPIVVFYFVTNLLVRIGLILTFTAVFSVILVWGLKIKPHASLAITTAIAAVQVVYVGSTAGDK